MRHQCTAMTAVVRIELPDGGCFRLFKMKKRYRDVLGTLAMLMDRLSGWATGYFTNIFTEWIVPQFFKLLPMRHIFFDLVIRFITNRKYAFFCIF